MRKWPLAVAVALILVGLLGLGSLAVVMTLFERDGTPRQGDRPGPGGRFRGRDPTRGRPDPDDFDSNGQMIYFTGYGRSRRIPRDGVPAHMHLEQSGCVGCHGRDGEGGLTVYPFSGTRRGRGVVSPDIRYETLTSPHEEDGGRKPGWTQAQVERATREGVEPDGNQLDAVMPRWDMRDGEMRDLVGYLKELE